MIYDLFFGAPKLDLLHYTNPLYRVAPRVLVGESGDFQYDREKYRDMLFESAETVLSIFGFKRTAYGDKPKKKQEMVAAA